ncbi:ABC transporter ATP-binding protein [Desulfobacula phenolica]|uniref:NitT/TauT family transport system ATP-binding protein n=1 Tax=Desulfobacula phenolica TaxID=90732 RepID=A0A1H2HER6_9BACT|nr:ABC transporter ATP-binding protein [Desulfobacula phenolica]SDU30370.1 NitT/TauT family transport system ATP-binding protein [Desulfobacula phenolica]
MKIKIDKVTKRYNTSAIYNHIVLKDISFSIDDGDFVIILGESGCGKTTLLNLLAGLELPTSGKIHVDGHQIRGIHPSRSMLFQQPTLIPWLNVKENVAYGCKLRGDTKELDYRVNQFLELMGIAGFSDAVPNQLSLGMAQRACLARALVGHPEILLLDEPFASLDTFTQAHIQEELVNLWLSEQFTAVFVTHDIDEAIRLGNKIILLAGEPANIIDIFKINTAYPRDRNASEFKKIRTKILERFKTSYIAKRSLL